MKLFLILPLLLFVDFNEVRAIKLGDRCFNKTACKQLPGAACRGGRCRCLNGYCTINDSTATKKCAKCPGKTSTAKPELNPPSSSQTTPEYHAPTEATTPGRSPPETCGTPAVTPSVRLGQAGERNHRIVGGTPALNCSYPYQAFIEVSSDGFGYICGGSIYNEWYIISAAHCGDGWTSLSDYEILLGTNYRYDGNAQKIGVEKVIVHENYDRATFQNDIMLLKLNKKIQFNDCVQPICMPTEDVPAGTLCVTTGWGHTASYTVDSNWLQQVAVPIVSTEVCFDHEHYGSPKVPFTMCAGYEEGGKDSCSGDSGGPLACVYKDGRFHLHGITSYGIGCALPKRPGVYTNVRDFGDWIRQKSV